MGIRLVLLALAFAATATSLRAEELYQLVPDAGKLPPTMAREHHKRGQVDQEGRLIFLTLHHSTRGTRNIAMKGDYGFLVFYAKSSGDEVEESYEFYSKKDRKIQQVATLHEFLELVSGMPRGSRLDLYNLCLAGVHKGYPPANWKRIQEACRKAGVTFDRAEPDLVCNCEGAKD